jgi:hypothetical protein
VCRLTYLCRGAARGLAGGLAALVSAVAVARRRVCQRIEFRRSWLAALPIRLAIVRREALANEAAPVGAAVTDAGRVVLATVCECVCRRTESATASCFDVGLDNRCLASRPPPNPGAMADP